ncbi:MAG: formylglycine-generating enzyme family protein [Planctomycetales bacterium]|nr:formylglycine-generating enzyme family protein [Planctomycetales bacterium]
MRNLLLTTFCILITHSHSHATEPTLALGLSKEKPAESRSVPFAEGYMTEYSEQIPGTEVRFTMVPIGGGEFLLGSPENEPERQPDEGPQVRIRVTPFWMGKCEVTWAEYHAFMKTYLVFKRLKELRPMQSEITALPAVKAYLEQESLEVDAVTSPTPIYDPDTTYTAGEDPDQPAVTMTQFAAKQYTKWLSGISGHTYRLPTEAEWEYAARAGTTTPFSFGTDASQIDDYAWYYDNADEQTHAVGSKRPNDWGLYDMHGNVAEWVLDEYESEHYGKLGAGLVECSEATRWPMRLYPRAIRGGSWLDEPSLCRSAARHKSDDPDWNLSDPNLPKSPWWYTEEPSMGVGFRIIRPLEPLDDETRKRAWDPDIEQIRQDVADRLTEGRGSQGAADPRLPAAIEELTSKELVD